MAKDAQGLTITGAPASAEAYDHAMADYWGLTGDPVRTLKSAIETDPAFALGAVAVAALFLVGGFPARHPEVVHALTPARKAIAATTRREQKHLAAVEAWAEGRLLEAALRWEDILVEAPRDALALRLVQDAYFFLGQPLAIRDSSARVKPFWDEADPLYGFLLGVRAFGLEEAGELGAAEDCAREAIERNPADAWAVHALAHVFETACRIDEGIEFLKTSRPHWTSAHFMAGHNGWHLGLYQIEQGRYAETLADYDRFAAPKLKDDTTLDRVDAAALLWRLELEGVDVGPRWAPVAEAWRRHVDDHVLAFNDLHLALAAARSPDPEDSKRLRASLAAYVERGQGDNRDTTAEVGLPIIDGVLKFAAADYRGAIEAITPVARRAIRIGGSHAQRDIVTLTLIAAAERAGDRALLRALLAERASVRPTAKVKEALARAM
jgi:tetratricopeptide (TPR) repeat protein